MYHFYNMLWFHYLLQRHLHVLIMTTHDLLCFHISPSLFLHVPISKFPRSVLEVITTPNPETSQPVISSPNPSQPPPNLGKPWKPRKLPSPSSKNIWPFAGSGLSTPVTPTHSYWYISILRCFTLAHYIIEPIFFFSFTIVLCPPGVLYFRKFCFISNRGCGF